MTTLYRKVIISAGKSIDGESPTVLEVKSTDIGTVTTVSGPDIGTIVIGFEEYQRDRAVESAVEFAKLAHEKIVAFAKRAKGVQL